MREASTALIRVLEILRFSSAFRLAACIMVSAYPALAMINSEKNALNAARRALTLKLPMVLFSH